jgi:hypothetical protein
VAKLVANHQMPSLHLLPHDLFPNPQNSSLWLKDLPNLLSVKCLIAIFKLALMCTFQEY